jgi:hypothetical protein
VSVLRLAADVGLIGFHNLVAAADGAALRIDSALAQPVEQEPRAFVRRADHAVKM